MAVKSKEMFFGVMRVLALLTFGRIKLSSSLEVYAYNGKN